MDVFLFTQFGHCIVKPSMSGLPWEGNQNGRDEIYPGLIREREGSLDSLKC